MTENNISSNSWMQLKPISIGLDLESFHNYLQRIRSLQVFNHVPAEIFEQWIHPLHQDAWTLRNYSWIDFTAIKFELQYWNYQQLLNINIIPDFQKMLAGIDSPLDNISACDSDLEFWKNHGTWRTPPIALDVNSLNMLPPKNATIAGAYQLVEGHSRYRNLRISKFRGAPLADLHKIYIMKMIDTAM